jgi:hypothetical protein
MQYKKNDRQKKDVIAVNMAAKRFVEIKYTHTEEPDDRNTDETCFQKQTDRDSHRYYKEKELGSYGTVDGDDLGIQDFYFCKI